MHRAKVLGLVVSALTPLVLAAACGGAIEPTKPGAPADPASAPPASSRGEDDAPSSPSSPSSPASSASPPADGAAVDGVSQDAAAFDASACGLVAPGLAGAASCGPNSPKMPLACTGGLPCATWCKAQNPYAFCASSDGGSPFGAVEPGMFLCYTCNP